MTGVLNCISSNSLWELDLLVSYLSLERKRSDSARCVCRAAEKARPAPAPSIPSIFSRLIFSGEPARTAPDTNAPSDRPDECELIGLMIFLPHFPPLYGCSMVHGADGWNQLPHTHILPNFNGPHISRTQHTGRKTYTNFCVFISFPRCSRT